jgi:folate-binding protein YgfZ
MTNQRSIFRISGDDRLTFLQGILTQDTTKLAEQKIQFAALLSPQGKLLHDMFLIDRVDHLLLDTAAAFASVLLKRLTMYKLRAKVVIEDIGSQFQVTLSSDGLVDPRHPELPKRVYKESAEPSQVPLAPLALGIPEFGIDIQPDTITGMDAGYDLLHAISFTKGCYVGQEVTARMHYKAIARKGFFLVTSEAPMAAGDSLMLGDRAIGTITRTEGLAGLAFLKFDDATSSQQITVNQAPASIVAPDWMQPKLAQFTNASQNQ